ncbi:MAG: hypothetical protein LBH19_13520, partial [Dysgonamonadaceae bacterium]|nr:hypothetical protein [Dysgonamonadaceae bacterium]
MKKNNLQKIKKLLFLLALLLAGSAMVAQQNIKMDPLEETVDQDAKNFPKTDPYNKLPMALIKVQAPATMACAGFTLFDFGSIGAGIIECKDGMTWVYAPAGASRVSIHHNTTGTEYNLELGKQLKGGTVYIMRLLPAKQIRIIEEDAVTQQFLVAQCDIEGATIDIQNYGREAFVNGVFTKMLPFGEYSYQVDAPRYMSDRGKFTIKPDGKTNLPIHLQANFAGVTLTGDGDIYINEQLKGSNRWTGELTKGQYLVEVRKAAHRSSTRTIDVEPDKPLNLQLNPPTPIYGKLQISCNTIGTIFIDGKEANETTPAILNNILI